MKNINLGKIEIDLPIKKSNKFGIGNLYPKVKNEIQVNLPNLYPSVKKPNELSKIGDLYPKIEIINKPTNLGNVNF